MSFTNQMKRIKSVYEDYQAFAQKQPNYEDSNAYQLASYDEQSLKFMYDTLALYVEDVTAHYSDAVMSVYSEAVLDSFVTMGLVFSGESDKVTDTIAIIAIELFGVNLIEVPMSKMPLEVLLDTYAQTAALCAMPEFLKKTYDRALEIDHRKNVLSSSDVAQLIA